MSGTERTELVRDEDHEFFERELASFVPERVFDAHAHLWHNDFSACKNPKWMPEGVGYDEYRQMTECLHPGRDVGAFFLAKPLVKKKEQTLQASEWIGKYVNAGPNCRGAFAVKPEDDPEWVRELYQFAVRPTIGFYFHVPLGVALDRILSGRPEMKWYEAGMDLGLAEDEYESFKLFQARILEQYDRMADEFGLTVIDGTLSIGAQQKQVRELVEPHLDGVLHRPEDAWTAARLDMSEE